jgi:hypothetical protein
MKQTNKGYTTTKKDFIFFKREINHWLQYFGLIDFDVRILHLKERDFLLGGLSYNVMNRTANITLNTSWIETKPDKYELAKTAFHEVVELLLSQLRNYSESYISEDEVNREIHKIIVIFENTVFQEYWEKKGIS